ncbi:MAG: 30S ribosome-binding factor RbfA [Patescibacteria group bacterium]
MSSRRIQQVNELIRHELGKILVREVTLPKGCLATITDVRTGSDLKNATVYVSTMPKGRQGSTVEMLNKRTGYFQSLLGNTLKLRVTPKLYFKLDPAEEQRARIDELIDKIHHDG